VPTPASRFRGKLGAASSGITPLPDFGVGEEAPAPESGAISDFGLVPEEARQQVRAGVEGMSLPVQLGVELGPSAVGTILGGTIGLLGGPWAPVTVPLAASLGSMLFEAGAQELGIAPESDLNLALACFSPVKSYIVMEGDKPRHLSCRQILTRSLFIIAERRT